MLSEPRRWRPEETVSRRRFASDAWRTNRPETACLSSPRRRPPIRRGSSDDSRSTHRRAVQADRHPERPRRVVSRRRATESRQRSQRRQRAYVGSSRLRGVLSTLPSSSKHAEGAARQHVPLHVGDVGPSGDGPCEGRCLKRNTYINRPHRPVEAEQPSATDAGEAAPREITSPQRRASGTSPRQSRESRTGQSVGEHGLQKRAESAMKHRLASRRAAGAMRCVTAGSPRRGAAGRSAMDRTRERLSET